MTALVGAKRFAHAGLLRGDQALRALLGMKRFPTDDTICNLFRKFGMGEVQRFFEPVTEWQMQRLPLRREGYTLDEAFGLARGVLWCPAFLNFDFTLLPPLIDLRDLLRR
jgi:hypothetical protein